MRKAKAFTLLEMVVVVFVVLFVIVVMFGPGYVEHLRNKARRVYCASQLSGMGKAIALYQQDFTGSNPALTQAGEQATSAGWRFFGSGAYNAVDDITADGRWYDPMWADNTHWPNDPCELRRSWQKTPTVGGCLYLLVQYEDLVPKMFLCPDAPYDREMNLKTALEADASGSLRNWADLRDFASLYNVSYGMHDPFKHPASERSPGDLAIMADKNPRFDNPKDKGRGTLNPTAGNKGQPTADQQSNSFNHGGKRQYVLYAGLNVKGEDTSTVGIAQDNIYTRWSNEGKTSADKSVGVWPEAVWDNLSAGPTDAYIGQ